MATYLSTDLTGSANATSVPVGFKPAASVVGGRTKTFRATFTYNSQATTDTLQLFTLPTGATFIKGWAYTSVSTSTATLAFGNSGSTGKYRAAAAITSTDTPNDFGITAAASAAPATAEEIVIATIGTAALPSSGTLTVYFLVSMPN